MAMRQVSSFFAVYFATTRLRDYPIIRDYSGLFPPFHSMKLSANWLLTVFLLLASISGLHAQREAAIWYIGDAKGLNFNCPPPKLLHGYYQFGGIGLSSMSDKQGNLLFYTTSNTIFNA